MSSIQENLVKQSAIHTHRNLVRRVPWVLMRKILTFNAVEYVAGLLGIPKWVVPIILFILL